MTGDGAEKNHASPSPFVSNSQKDAKTFRRMQGSLVDRYRRDKIEMSGPILFSTCGSVRTRTGRRN